MYVDQGLGRESYNAIRLPAVDCLIRRTMVLSVEVSCYQGVVKHANNNYSPSSRSRYSTHATRGLVDLHVDLRVCPNLPAPDPMLVAI